MTHATFDANVLVSAFLVKVGAPARLLRLWEEEQTFQLCLSDSLLAEVRDVLLRPRIIRRYAVTGAEVDEFVLWLAKRSQVASVADPPVVVIADPKDDYVLACALQTRSDVIVTGDRHLLDLSDYQGIAILTPARFLADLLQRPPAPILPGAASSHTEKTPERDD